MFEAEPLKQVPIVFNLFLYPFKVHILLMLFLLPHLCYKEKKIYRQAIQIRKGPQFYIKNNVPFSSLLHLARRQKLLSREFAKINNKKI